MLNGPFSTKEEALEAVKELWDANEGEFTLATYENDKVDMLVVTSEEDGDDFTPALLVPTSDRAKALLMRWGMDDWMTGIRPPQDAFDFFHYVPGDWTCGTCHIRFGAHIVQEITLPPPLTMVH